MEILTHKNLILGFIRQDLENKAHLKQIRQILENENSVFLSSKKFFSSIKEELGEEYEEEYKRLFTKFSDFGNSIASSPNSQNFDDEFIHLFTNTPSNVILALSLNDPSPAIKQAIPKIAVFTQQKKPNYHWLVVNLAICSPFTLSVDEANFTTDSEIDTFFDDLFSIPKKIESVTIFDDYHKNVFTHNKYNKIKKEKIYYCTSQKSEKNNTLIPPKEIYEFLTNNTEKKKFTRVILKTIPLGSHTRRIIFEGFVVNPDIDLSSLNRTDKKMWSVHIRFSKKLADDMIEISRGADYKQYKP